MVNMATPVEVEMVCGVCEEPITSEDAAMCVIPFPQMDPHMICVRDWAIIMSASYAWLSGEAPPPETARGDRVAAAARIFLASMDDKVKGEKNAKSKRFPRG